MSHLPRFQDGHMAWAWSSSQRDASDPGRRGQVSRGRHPHLREGNAEGPSYMGGVNPKEDENSSAVRPFYARVAVLQNESGEL